MRVRWERRDDIYIYIYMCRGERRQISMRDGIESRREERNVGSIYERAER